MMKKRYDSLDLRFVLGSWSFQPLNIVYERFQQDLPRHSHSENCYEIHLIPAGKGTVTLEAGVRPVSAGDLFVTGPHIEHAQHTDSREPMEEYCVFFQLSPARSSAGGGSTAESFRRVRLWTGRDTQGVQQLMEKLFRELEEKRPGYTEACRACLQLLVIAMTRCYEGAEAVPQPEPTLADQKSIILDESFLYEYRTITLGSLSRRLALSPRQTQRLLQLQYGQSFQQKRTEARMNAASSLLLGGRDSIASIAEQLGYAAPEHFSTAFRRFYGITPRQYREKYRKRR